MTRFSTWLRRIGPGVAGCSAVALMLTGCGPAAIGNDDGAPKFELSATTPNPSKEIDSFSWALYAEPFSLDYAYAFDYSDNLVLSNMCESLFSWNADLTTSPGLATKFEQLDDLTWVYTIRQGVHFHDGSLMSADDVVASLQRHQSEEVGSFWASSFDRVASIEKTGDYEVTITTTTPDYGLNSALVGAPGVIESAKTLAEAGTDYGNSSTGVNCTGPFMFDNWAPGESISLKRFDNYWDPEAKAKAKEMSFQILPDATARTNALQTGEIDGSWQVPSNAIDILKANTDAGNMYFGTDTSVQSLVTSNLEGVFADVRVRKALMMAINREALLRAAEQGYGSVTNGLTTKNVWIGAKPATVDAAFGELQTLDYDLEEAKRLVKEAGATGKKFVYATASITAAFDIASRAVASAAKEIGLEPEILTMSNDKYTTLFSDPEARKGIDIFETSWYLSSAEPLEMYTVLRTGDFSNYGGWSNTEFDDLVNEAIGTKDPDAKAQLTAQAAKIASDEVVWSPLYETVTSLWLGKRITGVAPSINYMYFPWAATIGGR
ncbi:ABC transporter substrate-binding protein [Arthrobacter psychrochitiniphilus]|uniref:Peptide ABC transporter substrate-binding protein n=1 Tax=Arthrobacter psychrochitiniphilus TaxID=291045 RepID=A0A2V3DQ23_9MICC|nr:ABC transporter substrate-binding protein [Arthrobacter psychrochitiniphilus]NYG17870.1 peptide/nickel transport system substrate-binding protein [Arthrobacter psychrochitiniphilus]PXA65102.1 peptide ABC transporter substrate-binding protein [Arthrobacter psychrochitiniphilus]